MNRRVTGALSALAVAAAFPMIATSGADAVPAEDGPAKVDKIDNRADSLATKRTALRQRAVNELVRGDATMKGRGKDRTIQLKHKGEQLHVDYPVTQRAQLLSFLVEFGDQPDPRFPDAPVGPQHNEIPEPAEEDNSTYWVDDFTPEHYKDMFFNGLDEQGGESFKDHYDEMSSGRFSLDGDVSDWVQVPHNQASYGKTESNEDMTRFIQDTADAWYQKQVDAGKSPEEIQKYLDSFDVWDRYDLDGDGEFNEPDGYIDHFQAIHAGEGEEAGAPESAIWSHRWAVNPNGHLDGEGPDGFAPAGGIQIGDSNVWIRDYTTEPENGGLGVFAHEFAHDLGLPDFYDTNGGENGTGFWTLMSSGSWLGHGDGAIGTTPNHMGPSEKLFLGWYGPNNTDLAVLDADEEGKVKLGPSIHATRNGAQAALVTLPDGEAYTDTGEGNSGSNYLYSGNGDDRTSTATSSTFTVPDGGQLSAQVAYSIETDWDYAYVEVSTDGGQTFTPIETNLSTTENPNNANQGFGITGSSVQACQDDPGGEACFAPAEEYTELTADLSEFAGQDVQLRFRHANDAAMHEFGMKIDDVQVGDAFFDDFKAGFDSWTLSTNPNEFYGITDGGYTTVYEHSYMVENRQYRGYDTTLATGPYNFGWTQSAPNTVEHYPYQDGMLVWYINDLYGDNNTSQHPGFGQALPVDANPTPITWSNGDVARNRVQAHDATFDVDTSDALTLHREAEDGSEQTLEVPARAGNAVFDDSEVDRYWDPANPAGSTKVAGTGVQIEVLKSKEKHGRMKIEVRR